MAKIALVTDSTAYIPDHLVNKYSITVLPQLLIWEDHTYRDGIDITPVEFYTRLKSTRNLPTTAQVSEITMEKIFHDLVYKEFDVLGVFLSARLSGTVDSAFRGREALGSEAEKVSIIESNSTSMAMGFQILAAARLADEGASLSECRDLICRSQEHIGVYFAIDTLEFIHRGGRIGGAQRFIGSALNLKPVLTIKDGRVEPEDRVRTMKKAQNRLIELVSEHVKGKLKIHIASLHANAESAAMELLDHACELFNPVESLISSVSPVVGTHAGPRTVGLAYMEGI